MTYGGEISQILSKIRSQFRPTLDFVETTKLANAFKRIPSAELEKHLKRKTKVAILSSSTSTHVQTVLDFSLKLRGIVGQFWSADYNLESLILGKDSKLESFAPDICLLRADHQRISHWPQIGCTEEEYNKCLKLESERWLHLQKEIHNWLGCTIIQDNFTLPLERPLGHLEQKVFGGRGRFVSDLNRILANQAPSFVRINDVAFHSSRVGLYRWTDRRLWHHGKLALSLDAVPFYCHQLSSLICAIYGGTKKCLVVDLDNTLWGGAIGDDGLSGIKIGEGSAEGEAFKAFQEYLKHLKSQGVLLAVCSKNEISIAREAFEKNQDMSLKFDDFAIFVANWKPKSENLKAIAQKLNIGIDSLVFFDDNPAEREEVQMNLPEVYVVDVPQDPSNYIDALDELNLFEPANLAAEDLNRTQLYFEQTKRAELETSVTDYPTYLRSLEMKAVVAPFQEVDIARISQLINKTNQFNVTTRRYTEEDCRRFMNDSRYVTRSVRLKDKFGDHGLISVFIGKIEADEFEVDTWLMSCRDLKCGVEDFLFNDLVSELGQKNIKAISGTYIPTAKNNFVKDLYERLGFTCIEKTDEATRWKLQSPFHLKEVFIKFEKSQ